MSERITKENVETRCANVNRRMESRGSVLRYEVQGRNGKTALDRFRVGDANPLDLVVVGTKREVADYLHAMMVALDDSARVK